MKTSLNWKELHRYLDLIRPEVKGARILQIFIPQRPELKTKYRPHEWALRLDHPDGKRHLLIGTRPGAPYFVFLSHPGPKACLSAPLPPFIQGMRKHLVGTKIENLSALEKERWVQMECSSDLSLYFSLIPSDTEILLVKRSDQSILFRSRTTRKETQLKFPDPRPTPEVTCREELFETPETYGKALLDSLSSQGKQNRLQPLLKAIEKQIKQIEKQLMNTHETLTKLQKEPDWKRLGRIYQSHMHSLPKKQIGNHLKLKDFESEKTISLKVDPKLKPAEQLHHFFEKEKKKQRTLNEIALRQKELENKKTTLGNQLEEARNLADESDASKIMELEKQLGRSEKTQESLSKQEKKWKGKTFQTKEGLSVLVGRNLEENLKLTFQIAKGNDLWFHLRGKPSAHAVLLVPKNKTPSLESLLDAAQIVSHFSGKFNGKTEVDYTFRKYVKRIKGSSKVSYSQNKTLHIEKDNNRLKRLLGKD